MVRSNHRLAEPRRRERGHVWRDAPHARRRESIATGEKRREIFAEQRGEHVESSIDEVHGGSPLARLEVQRGTLADETRHVRDVRAHLPPGAVGQRRDGHGVVHVHASGGIDGHRSRAAHVASTRHLIGGDGPPDTLGGKIRQRRGSERRVGNVETRQARRRLRVGVPGVTQDAKHARVRMSTRRAPPVDANQKTPPTYSRRRAAADEPACRAIGRNRQDAPERRASRPVGRKLRRVRLGDDRDVIRATRAKDADHDPPSARAVSHGGARRGVSGRDASAVAASKTTSASLPSSLPRPCRPCRRRSDRRRSVRRRRRERLRDSTQATPVKSRRRRRASPSNALFRSARVGINTSPAANAASASKASASTPPPRVDTTASSGARGETRIAPSSNSPAASPSANADGG